MAKVRTSSSTVLALLLASCAGPLHRSPRHHPLSGSSGQHLGGELALYVGTYTRGESKGIYVYRMDATTGEIRFTGESAALKDPSFLALHPSGRFLYSVSRTQGGDGQTRGGTIWAFRVDPATGGLSQLNWRSSHGKGPCHLSVTPDGCHVLVANYGSGTVAALPVAEDGSLGEATATVQHEGSGPNPKRQRGPHAHSITPSPDGRHAVAADLGIDRLMVYSLDHDSGALRPAATPAVPVQPGAGPRHFAFHPTRNYAYAINELDCTVAAFRYSFRQGRLTPLQTVSTLPAQFAGPNTGADIHISPDGRFLYGSNRGHDSIVAYRIGRRGRLTPAGHFPTEGRNPRNFAIDPTGHFLLAANQDSNTIVVLKRNPKTGTLKSTGNVVSVPSPVCIQFAPREPSPNTR